MSNCATPEVPLQVREEEALIHSEYSAGSLVWARMPGWPWWPAMVDDCPDAEQFYWLDGFSDIPTHYNVVFFDAFDVTRSWIAPENLKPYNANKNKYKLTSKEKKYKKRIDIAMTQANEAERLTPNDRLAKYSFVVRYKGNINTPRKVNRKDLKKFQNQLKRKFNIDFPIESSSDEEDFTAPAVSLDKKTAKTKANKKNKLHNDTNTNGILTEMDPPVVKDNTTSSNNVSEMMKANSMAVHIGSNTESVDQDSSKTYVPDNTHETETESMGIEIRVATPNSDDFDFN